MQIMRKSVWFPLLQFLRVASIDQFLHEFFEFTFRFQALGSSIFTGLKVMFALV